MLCYKPDEIIAHLNLSSPALNADEIRLSHRERRGLTELTVCARERPGLFADLSGLLALNDIVIHSARLFSLSDGSCIDHFDVGLPWEDFDAWPRLQRQFAELSHGELDLVERLKRKRSRALAGQIVARIDNSASDFYSLLEIDAPESTALLHALARCLSESGVDIHRAYLASRGSRASMTFYLTDRQGDKLAGSTVELADALARLASP